MVAYNDYRTVDYLEDPGAVVPPSLHQRRLREAAAFPHAGPWRSARGAEAEKKKRRAGGRAAAQAFIGLSFSDNGGKDWYTGLHPGHRSLPPAAGVEPWDRVRDAARLRGGERPRDGDDGSPVLRRRDRVHSRRRKRRLRLALHRSEQHGDRTEHPVQRHEDPAHADVAAILRRQAQHRCGPGTQRDDLRLRGIRRLRSVRSADQQDPAVPLD